MLLSQILKMKRIAFLSLIVFLFCNRMLAQYARTSISAYQFNAFPINPAYAGSNYYTSLDVTYFGNVTEADQLFRSVDVSLHGALREDWKTNLGVGLKFIQEGAVNELRLRPAFAYGMKAGEGRLTLGTVVGLNYFDFNEEVLFNFPPNFFSLDLGFGLYFHSDHFFMGLSALNVFESVLKNEKSLEQLDIDREKPLYFSGGFVARINDRFMVKPSVLLKYSDHHQLVDNSNTEDFFNEFGADFEVALIIDKAYWVSGFFGVSDFENVETINRFGLTLHFLIDNLRLSYGIHRTTLTNSNIEFPVSHLFSIGFDFDHEEETPLYRFF